MYEKITAIAKREHRSISNTLHCALIYFVGYKDWERNEELSQFTSEYLKEIKG